MWGGRSKVAALLGLRAALRGGVVRVAGLREAGACKRGPTPSYAAPVHTHTHTHTHDTSPPSPAAAANMNTDTPASSLLFTLTQVSPPPDDRGSPIPSVDISECGQLVWLVITHSNDARCHTAHRVFSIGHNEGMVITCTSSRCHH